MGLLHRRPALDRARRTPAFAVDGDEPELVEAAGGEGDGGGDEDAGRAGTGGEEELGHGAGADAPGFQAGGSGRQGGGGERAGGSVPSGVGGGFRHLLGRVAQDVNVPQGIDAGGIGTPPDHALADEGVERGGGIEPEVFLGLAGGFQGGLGGGLGGAEGARGGGEGADGGAEGDEQRFRGLVGEALAEVADGVELFFAGAVGEGLAALRQEDHVGGTLVGDLPADGGVPGFQQAVGVGIRLAGEAGHEIVEGQSAARLRGLGIGDGGLAGGPGTGGEGQIGDDIEKRRIAADGDHRAGHGVGQKLAHKREAVDGACLKRVLGVFGWGGGGHGFCWFCCF